MDADYNLTNFANDLKKQHVKRKVFLYESRNQGSSGAEKHNIKDVVSGVAKQLKAIQQADRLKKQSSASGIPNIVKKFNFLPVHMVPVEKLPKQNQTHKFDTQCELDTQLINIIEDAEAIIDVEKGITQEFDTVFCHKDVGNFHNTTAEDEILYIAQDNTLSQKVFCEDDKSDILDNLRQPASDGTNLHLHNCNISDNTKVKYSNDVIKGMTQEFDITFCQKDQDDNVEKNRIKNDINIQDENGCYEILENNVDNITEQHMRTDLSNKACTVTIDNQQTDNLNLKKLSSIVDIPSTNINIKHLEPKIDKQNKKDVCDTNDTYKNFYACEDDNNNYSQNELTISLKVDELKSPILNKIQADVKSNSPFPLIYKLDSFEKFESIVLPIIEKYDYEIAKRVVNSHTLNRELFINTHAEAVLSDRDKDTPIIPILKYSIKSESSDSLNVYSDHKVALKKDSMLFSSDEEDVLNKSDELPTTCTFRNSFESQTDILDKSMYVGFQTASNKCIQISTHSYNKAKNIFECSTNIDKENLLSGGLVDMLDYSKITNIRETELNVFDNICSVPDNDNIVKINLIKQLDDIGTHKLHDCGMAYFKREKHFEDVHVQKKSQISNADDIKVSNITNTNHKCEDFTQYLQIDKDIVEEFNKDLIPDTSAQYAEVKVKNIELQSTHYNGKLKKTNDFFDYSTGNNNSIKFSLQTTHTNCITENIENGDSLCSQSGKYNLENHHSSDCAISVANFRNEIDFNGTSDNESVRPFTRKSELYPALSLELNSKLQGFKTETNKPEDNKIFHNIININENNGNSIHNTVSTTFGGFMTASNKPVKISESALSKTKTILQDTDINNEMYDSIFKQTTCDRPAKSSYTHEGLKTARNNNFKRSESALTKEKNIFQQTKIDNTENINNKGPKIPSRNTAPNGFKTASNRIIPISKQQLAKSKNIFQDILDTKASEVKFDNTKDKSPILVDESTTTEPIIRGFQTASNKLIKVSGEALSKTKKIFQDIDMNHYKENNDELRTISEEKHPTSIVNKSQNAICQGFKTASNIPVGISAEALIKSKKIFKDFESREESDENFKEKSSSLFPIANRSLNNICEGFKTASNKSVKISKEALSKMQNIFQDIDIKVHKNQQVKCDDSNNILKEKQLYYTDNSTQKAIYPGIHTEGNKIRISHTHTKPETILNGIEIANDEGKQVNDNLEKSKKCFHESKEIVICQEFKMAYNKPVEKFSHTNIVFQNNSVDREINNRCEQANKKTIELPSKNRHGYFTSTASYLDPKDNKSSNDSDNTHILVAEKSRNLLNDFDKSMKSNPDLNSDDAIQENVGLEDINTEVIRDFEDTVYTEDFIKKETPKSKRSGSPILSCPKAKKAKKFETPVITKKFVAPAKSKITIKTDTNYIYKFDEEYKKFKKYSLKNINEIEKLNNAQNVDPYIIHFKFDTLLDFKFTGNRNDFDSDIWTIDKIKRLFSDSVNKRIIPEGWMENHLKLIIWKLVSYEIRFPVVMKNICSIKNVLEQLNHRYMRELYNVERPALRKILERDEVSTRRMILCVAGLFVEGVNIISVTNETQNIELLLTDGWYTIKASTDRMIDGLVCKGKIGVGTKLVIHGAELLNCDQGIAPWEDTSSVRLKISGNSIRRAKWDARLGFHGNGGILTRLSHVKPEGGKISHLRTLITRVYPPLYIEKFPDGSTLTRSERLENIYQMKYETERQIQMEKLYEELERLSDQESQDSEGQYLEDIAVDSGSQISRLMKKSRDRDEFRAKLTSTQAYLLQQHTLKQKDKLVQALQDKFQELVKKRGLDTPRNVVPLMKIRVADLDTGGVTKAMITIWKPNETIQDMLTEGTWIDLYNVVPTSVRYSELQISAGRQSIFRIAKLKENDKLKNLAQTLKRQCYTIKDLQNPYMNSYYNEIDTVGLIFFIDPPTKEFEEKNQPFQNVYLTDENKNIICVNFWGGIKKFGFQNILDTGQIVTCVNLQKRAGNTRKNIPQYRATEFSYFTKISKIESVRKMADDLTAKFCSLDKRKFIDDCVSLKSNYHNIKRCNTENISPYRLNTSDYNVYKNKVFIESPLHKCTDQNFNLTGLDFESTFKQTETQDLSPQMLIRKRKCNEKIAKLKMYGEPPPLNTIHIINKSSDTVKAFKSPFSNNCISTNVASSNALPRNCEAYSSNPSDSKRNQISKECEGSVTYVPQNDVNKNNSSPILNRTYVKRASINPVKLNFSNAIETSITDAFAEEFDGSPPLSLDLNNIS